MSNSELELDQCHARIGRGQQPDAHKLSSKQKQLPDINDVYGNFSAPKPEDPPYYWIKAIAKRIIFPPIMLWDIAKYAANKIFGKAIGTYIVPGPPIEYIGTIYLSDYETDTIEADYYDVTTHDQAKLTGIQLIHNDNNLNRPHIIHFLGNCQTSDDDNELQKMQYYSVTLGANVFSFDYRGVNLSKAAPPPQSKNDLVTDGIAQVRRLLNAGVPPHKIYLKGFSMGGGISTEVAHHFLLHGIKLNEFNQNSFSSITKLAVGHVRKAGMGKTGYRESIGGKILGWIARPIIKFALALTKWEINAADKYKKLPEKQKEYIVVKSSKTARTKVQPVDDAIITDYGSLHTALKDENRSEKYRLDEGIRRAKYFHGSNSAICKHLQLRRDHLKARKMHLPTKYSRRDGHCADERDLFNHKGQSAVTFFHNFVARTEAYHEKILRCKAPR